MSKPAKKTITSRPRALRARPSAKDAAVEPVKVEPPSENPPESEAAGMPSKSPSWDRLELRRLREERLTAKYLKRWQDFEAMDAAAKEEAINPEYGRPENSPYWHLLDPNIPKPNTEFLAGCLKDLGDKILEEMREERRAKEDAS